MNKPNPVQRGPSKLSADRMQFLTSKSVDETEDTLKPPIAPKKPVLRRFEEQSKPECPLKSAREKLKNVESPSKEDDSVSPRNIKPVTHVQKSFKENANAVEKPNDIKEPIVKPEKPGPIGSQKMYPTLKKADSKLPGDTNNNFEDEKVPPSLFAAKPQKGAPSPIATKPIKIPPSSISTKSDKEPPFSGATMSSKEKPRQLKTEGKPNETIAFVDKPSENKIETELRPPPVVARLPRPAAVITHEKAAKTRTNLKISRSQDNDKIENQTPKEQLIDGQEWKSYRLLTLPKTDTQPPRKPARPPSVNLKSFTSQQEKKIPAQKQPQPIESESEEETYEDLDDVRPNKSVRPISLLTEEQEEEERALAAFSKPLPPLPTAEDDYDDTGMQDDDGELYQELD